MLKFPYIFMQLMSNRGHSSNSSDHPNPALVQLVRGDRVESIHRGALVLADAAGRVVLAMGDGEQVCYPRSALKMFQALPAVTMGITSDLHFSGEDHALLMASHSGEPAQTKRVAAMLEKLQLSMDDLECGCHEPYHHATAFDLEKNGQQPCPLHNNCSGKHTGMLATAVAQRLSTKNYIAPDHGVQVAITRVLEHYCGTTLTAPAVDGCSAPTWCLPLQNMAMGLARWGTGFADAHACQLLFRSATAHPYFIAGTGRHCTDVMQTLSAQVLVKMGAEGFYAVVVPSLGLGAVIKIDDGHSRAAELVLNSLLQYLRLKNADRLLTSKPIKSFRGIPAGEIAITPALANILRLATT